MKGKKKMKNINMFEYGAFKGRKSYYLETGGETKEGFAKRKRITKELFEKIKKKNKPVNVFKFVGNGGTIMYCYREIKK